MLKNITLIVLFSLPFFLFSQKEGNQWYFGANAGIDFNTQPPTPNTNGAMSTPEGCASISDNMGNLLFYTNGVTVWNKEHEVMLNGNDLFGNESSSQSAIIVKQPGLNDNYYIFTTGHQADVFGLRFTIVDMSLDNGLGGVTNIKNLELQSRVLEKIVAIRQDNMVDYWIVTHLWDTTTFHSYELTASGIEFEPVESDVGSSVVGGSSTAMGYMSANQDGDQIALAHGGFLHNVEVFDFDKESGEVSNAIILDEFILDEPYGVAFSPNGEVLYASVKGEPGTVYQYDLLAGNDSLIKESRIIVGSGHDYGGALQLAPDGKIYHAAKDSEWLGVINNPDQLGLGCDYVLEGFYLDGKLSEIGLPNFVNSIYQQAAVSVNKVCIGDSTYFTINFPNIDDEVSWNFGDPESGEYNQSTLFSPAHHFSDTGNYVVSITYFSEGEEMLYEFNVRIHPYPIVDLGPNSGLCEGQEITLDVSIEDGYYLWQDGSIRPNYTVTERGTYWVDVTVNSCIESDTVIYGFCDEYIAMPTIFTPNGDGKNDIFIPIDYKDVSEASIQIFSRWGKIVYESESVLSGWDGMIETKEGATGVYFYVLSYIGVSGNNYQIKGNITLVR